ncbi:hypothetical protein [Azospirillum sp. sgz302134]
MKEANTNLAHLRARLAADREASCTQSMGHMPLRQRIDPGSILLWAGLVAGFSALVALAFLGASLLGWLERPGAAPLPDERLLGNLRDGIAERPFLDAVAHNDGALYVSRRGQVVHRWSASTGLWSDETVADSGLTSDLVALQSGCGEDATAARRQPCPVEDTLWGLSQRGGLARRQGGVWTAVFADNRFLDRNGHPVKQDDVTAVAASPDGLWLLLATNRGEVGLYQRRTRRWFPAPAVAAVAVARWSGNRFWLGTTEGLDWILPDEKPSRGKAADGNGSAITGRIRDLATSGTESLLVLEERPCPKSSGQCTRLTRVPTAHMMARPVTLIDEEALFPQLDLGRMRFAQFQQADLVIAGDPGVYAYDQRLHGWRQLDEGRVSAVLASTDARSFLYAAGGTVRLVANGALSSRAWTLPEGPIHRLAGYDGMTLALSRTGNLYGLMPNGDVRVLWKPGAQPMPTDSPQRIVGAGDQLLVVTAREAVLADMATGERQALERRTLPGWLADAKSPVAVNGSQIIGMRSGANRTAVEAIDLVRPATLSNPSATMLPVGDVQWLRPWNRGAILADRANGLWSVVPGETGNRIVGDPLPAGTVLRDVVEDSGLLRFATDRGLVTYDPQSRSFSGPTSQSADGGRLRRLARHDNRLLAVSDAGSLFDLTNPASPVRLIGSGRPLLLPESGPTDAMSLNDTLFLGGNGVIEIYDMARRRVEANPLRLGGSAEPVRFAGVNGTLPVSMAGDRAWVGDKPLAPDAGGVRTVFLSGNRIWTVRNGVTGRYLRGHLSSAPLDRQQDTCLFLNASLPGATRAIDAQPAGPDHLVVLTDVGLAVYHMAERSWRRIASGPASPEDRLHSVGRHLLRATRTQDGWHLKALDLASLKLPASCESGFASMHERAIGDVVDYAVHPAEGRVVLLTAAGAVTTWADGTSASLLSANPALPQTDRFLRVAKSGDKLLFAAPDALWRYTPSSGEWRQISFPLPSSSMATDVVMEPAAGGVVVTAVTATGERFTGSLKTDATRISLTPIGSPVVPPLPPDTGPPRDIHLQGNRWVFLFDRQIRGFDPESRRWAWSVEFEKADPTRRFGTVGNMAVVTERNGRTWWIAKGRLDERHGPVASLFNRFDQKEEDAAIGFDGQGNLVRHRTDGAVQFCRFGTGDGFQCRAAVEPAPLLEPDVVRGAYQTRVAAGTLLLLFTDGGARLLFGPSPDAETNWREIPLRGSIGAEPVRGVWSAPNGFRLVTGSGRLLSIADDGSVVTSLEGVTDMVAMYGTLVAVRDDQGFWLNGGEPRAVLSLATKARLLRMMPNGDSAALDEAGRLLVDLRWGRPSSYRLPKTVDAAALRSVVPGQGDVLAWVQDGARLLFLVAAPCSGDGPPDAAPCTAVQDSIDLGESPPVTAVTKIPGGLSITVQGGATLRASLNSDPTSHVRWAVSEEGGRTGAWSAAPLPDEWPRLRARVAPRPDGRHAFGAVTELRGDEKEGLVAVTPTGRLPLAARGIVGPPSVPPLSTDWSRWDPETRQFIVASPTGETRLSADQMFVNGQPLFGMPGVAVATDDTGTTTVATALGVWRYPNSLLSLKAGRITFQPASLSGRIVALPGRFVGERGSAAYRPGTPAAPEAGTVEISAGKLVLSGDQRSPGVTARFERQGQTIDAFASFGFRWDRREGVAWHDDGPLILYTDGAQPAGSLDGGIAPPSTAGPGTFRRAPAGNVLYRTETEVFQYTGKRWNREEKPPSDRRTIVSDSAWEWWTENGRVVASSRAWNVPQMLTSGGDGLGLASDQLVSAAGDGSVMLLSTSAGIEQHPAQPASSSPAVRRISDIPRETLEVVAEAGVKPSIVTRAGGVTLRWKDGAFVPVESSADPRLKRRLVSTGRLRIDWDQGVLRTTVLLRAPQGAVQERWAPFALGPAGFPFDRVSAVQSAGRRLYVATDAGLAIGKPDAGYALSDMEALLDLNKGDGEAPEPAVRLGYPSTKPDRLTVTSTGRCWTVRGTAAVPCEHPGDLDTRVAVSTPFWEWLDSAGTGLRGLYRVADPAGRATAPYSVIVAGGRFGHDRIADAADCDGTTTMLWEDGLVTRYPRDETGVTGNATTFRVADPTAPAPKASSARFVCLDKAVVNRGVTIAPGLYLSNPPQRPLRYGRDSWTSVDDGRAAAMLDRRAQETPPFVRGGFRVEKSGSGAGIVATFRDNRDIWRPLSWSEERLSVHRFDDLAVMASSVWVATPDGLIRFAAPDSSRPWRLDLDDPVIVPWRPLLSEPCRADEMLVSEETLAFRCREGERTYAATVEGSRADMRIAVHKGPDPFSLQALPVAPPWDATLVRHPGGDQRLDLRLAGETLALTGGRFPFDRIERLLSLRSGIVDVLSKDKGWYEVLGSERDMLPSAAFRRPTVSGFDPATAVSLHAGLRDGKPEMCVASGAKGSPSVVRALPDGAPAASSGVCADVLASADGWEYRVDTAGGAPAALRIVGHDGKGRTGQRRLSAGRFTDDAVRGFPVFGREPDGWALHVPTASGVQIIEADGAWKARRLPPFDGLPAEAAPTALYRYSDQKIQYLTGDGLHDLWTGTGTAEGARPGTAPPQHIAITDGPGHSVRIRWTTGHSPEGDGAYAERLKRPVIGLEPAMPRRQSPEVDGAGDSAAVLRPTPSGIGVVRSNRLERDITLARWAGRPLLPIRLTNIGDRLILVEPNEIWEIDLGVATGGSHPLP